MGNCVEPTSQRTYSKQRQRRYSSSSLEEGWFKEQQRFHKEYPTPYAKEIKIPFMEASCGHVISIHILGYHYLRSSNYQESQPQCLMCGEDLSEKVHKVYCPCGCKRYRRLPITDILRNQRLDRSIQANTYPYHRYVQ